MTRSDVVGSLLRPRYLDHARKQIEARSGGFEPLRLVPEDRIVVRGLVSTKRSRLETQDELERRIEEAARVVPLDRLALSPQCGFASTWECNRITEADQNAKLELVARTARAVWG